MRFSMLSGKEIRQSAEAQVWNNRIYGPDMKPVPNGLLDTRMGAANKQGDCGTCHGSYTECPGHFGYLKLALPVFNVSFFNNILDVVKCICKGCSRVLLVEKDRREFLKKARRLGAGASALRFCPGERTARRGGRRGRGVRRGGGGARD
ncbi:DNA-directed RNA polymerase III subunit 1-like [Hordeum vulgare subsp. vulgare]|uniref:DNA-directed RNA polymerase III subunit 1-like n=1 Tax=Hordeum vulgare subsp. vulgare TaxID=112509 RepID=UPI000B47380E|nr:DNA-directed RNA polymerase III subunit 1-like [Hordeum vulgare subsp. vulgare]